MGEWFRDIDSIYTKIKHELVRDYFRAVIKYVQVLHVFLFPKITSKRNGMCRDMDRILVHVAVQRKLELPSPVWPEFRVQVPPSTRILVNLTSVFSESRNAAYGCNVWWLSNKLTEEFPSFMLTRVHMAKLFCILHKNELEVLPCSGYGWRAGQDAEENVSCARRIIIWI